MKKQHRMVSRSIAKLSFAEVVGGITGDSKTIVGGFKTASPGPDLPDGSSSGFGR